MIVGRSVLRQPDRIAAGTPAMAQGVDASASGENLAVREIFRADGGQIMDSEEHGSRAPERRQDERRDHPLRDAAPDPEIRLSRAGCIMRVNER